MTTYDRVKDVLSDGDWHSLEELKQVSYFPERWLDELRRDGLEVLEEDDRVALATHGSAG
jgi:hypothetical protein